MGKRQASQKNRPEAQGAEEIRDAKTKRSKRQKGPQAHAEGAHGAKTHRRLIETLQSGAAEIPRQKQVARSRDRSGHRLVEDRQQHDEAEKNSEKNRLSRYLGEEGTTRQGYQVPGGHRDETITDTPQS